MYLQKLQTYNHAKFAAYSYCTWIEENIINVEQKYFFYNRLLSLINYLKTLFYIVEAPLKKLLNFDVCVLTLKGPGGGGGGGLESTPRRFER